MYLNIGNTYGVDQHIDDLWTRLIEYGMHVTPLLKI